MYLFGGDRYIHFSEPDMTQQAEEREADVAAAAEANTA